ncbi:MAG: ATP-binding protein [Acidobacteria bacterium]|nr:ATP-binding protein [Acidobacteriota bacterium]
MCAQPPEVLENDTLEVKGWCNDEKELAEKVVDAASCLANARGGTLLVGVETRSGASHFSGCPYSDVSPQWLAA